MRRIVHVLHQLDDRAIADVVRCVAGAMHAADAEVTIIATAVDDQVATPAGVSVIDLGRARRRTVTSTVSLARALRLVRPDVVYAHAPGPTRNVLLAGRLGRMRPVVVAVLHNHYSSYAWTMPRLRRVIDRAGFQAVDALTGVSPGVVGDLVQTFPRTAGRTAVLPAPLTRWARLGELADEVVDHPWLGGPIPTLVSVAHLHPRKDQKTLIRALELLHRQHGTAARLLLIGALGTPYAEEVRQLVGKLGLTDHVDFLGQRNNPLPYIARADALVLSSTNEGMGLVLLEAQAVGTPAIATDAPSGPRWLLEDGRSGLLCPISDPTALADTLHRALTDPALRDAVVQAGRERVKAFRPEDIARRYLEIAAAAARAGHRGVDV